MCLCLGIECLLGGNQFTWKQTKENLSLNLGLRSHFTQSTLTSERDKVDKEYYERMS